ncbi:hypothetical protein MMC24_002046 [Lignoscripta atroalba]|nr:hypothetical protein [Lignoscripta atroalba]
MSTLLIIIFIIFLIFCTFRLKITFRWLPSENPDSPNPSMGTATNEPFLPTYEQVRRAHRALVGDPSELPPREGEGDRRGDGRVDLERGRT